MGLFPLDLWILLQVSSVFSIMKIELLMWIFRNTEFLCRKSVFLSQRITSLYLCLLCINHPNCQNCFN